MGKGIVELEGELIAGLAPEEALNRALKAERVGELGAYEQGFYLADIEDRGAFVGLGCATMDLLIRARCREALSTVRRNMSTSRALRTLPLTRQAFLDDRISWAHVKALVPVVTPETERRWLEWAIGKRSKAVERHAARREKGDLPSDPARRRIHTPTEHRGASLTPLQVMLWEQVRSMLEAASESKVSDQAMLLFLLNLVGTMRPDGTIPGWKTVASAPFLLHVKQGADGKLFLDDPETGEPLPFDPAELGGFRSKEVAEALRPQNPDEVEVVVEAAALDPENNGHQVPEAEKAPATSKALREEALVRDSYRCRCCGSKEELSVHHRRWRTYGGLTVLENLLVLCIRCHSLVHARLLIVLGDPDKKLQFLDRQGRPIERGTPLPVEIPVVAAPEPAQPDQVTTVPEELTIEEWRRHQHLFTWNERQGELVFEPGFARVTAEQAREGKPPQIRLGDLVGQKAARERVATLVAAAKRRGEQPPHLLLCGLPGVGKTLMAEATAGELGAPLRSLPAAQVKTPEALLRALTSLQAGQILFMDELQALPVRVAEVLYEALDRGTLTLSVRHGHEQRTLRLLLPPFTLIGATTDEDQLPKPLLSRLRPEQLELYPVDELAELLDRAAQRLGLRLTPEAASLLAGASRDTPRQGLSLLGDVRDEATVARVELADATLVERALARRGVDRDGLDVIDRAYLREVRRACGPLSLSTLAARLGVSEGRLARVHEPFLLRRGLIEITARGRAATR